MHCFKLVPCLCLACAAWPDRCFDATDAFDSTAEQLAHGDDAGEQDALARLGRHVPPSARPQHTLAHLHHHAAALGTTGTTLACLCGMTRPSYINHRAHGLAHPTWPPLQQISGMHWRPRCSGHDATSTSTSTSTSLATSLAASTSLASTCNITLQQVSAAKVSIHVI